MNNQNIFYSYQQTRFGNSFIAWTKQKSICCFYFLKDNERIDFEKLKKEFDFDNSVEFIENSVQSKKLIDQIFDLHKQNKLSNLKLFFKGTDFQIKVWCYLSSIPFGTTASYKDFAISMGKPKAIRAVASAIAKNKIAFVIPCHRVIYSSGKLGGYKWGVPCKKMILEWEREEAKIKKIAKKNPDLSYEFIKNILML